MANFKNIALVLPNSLGSYGSANLVVEHLGLGLLSSVLEKNGFSNEIIDARMYNLTPEQAFEKIKLFDLIGLSFPLGESEALIWALKFINKCKVFNPDIKVIAGGYLPTILPERVFKQIPDIDLIVMGEGEETLIDIIYAFKNGTNFELIPGIAYKKMVLS